MFGKPHPRPDQRRRNGKLRQRRYRPRRQCPVRHAPREFEQRPRHVVVAGHHDQPVEMILLRPAARLGGIAARVGGDPIDIDAAIEQRLLARQLRQPPPEVRVDAGDQQPPALVERRSSSASLIRCGPPVRTTMPSAWPEKTARRRRACHEDRETGEEQRNGCQHHQREQLAQAPRRPAAFRQTTPRGSPLTCSPLPVIAEPGTFTRCAVGCAQRLCCARFTACPADFRPLRHQNIVLRMRVTASRALIRQSTVVSSGTSPRSASVRDESPMSGEHQPPHGGAIPPLSRPPPKPATSPSSTAAPTSPTRPAVSPVRRNRRST